MSDEEDETATIIVLRSSDARKAKFEMNMSDSLNDLKDNINSSTEFGPLARTNQRIFHLGRELKTGGRSLSALGLGRFRVFTVHMMAKEQPQAQAADPPAAKNDTDDDDVVEVLESSRSSKRRATTRSRVAAAARNQQQQNNQSVIELSDDDDEDDDDDDDVVIERLAPKRRRRA